MLGKPLFFVGAAREDLRAFPIHTLVEHRVFYIAKYAEAVYVLHVFEKKTQQTRLADVEVGRARLKTLDQLRNQSGLARTRRNDG